MNKSRLEAFSDGVIAILITIMVLELRAPHGSDWGALRGVVPSILTYMLSFVLLGIYWNNHHHMLQATDRINGATLWANLHLLFWLSLVPFVTSWMGDNHYAAIPTALYGVVLLCCALAYTILLRTILAAQGGTVAGIVVSLAQILTSIQDSSFSTVPRLTVFLATLLLAMPWMVMRLISYTSALLGNLGKFAHG